MSDVTDTVLDQLRDAVADIYMHTPVEIITARTRRHHRQRLGALTAAAAALIITVAALTVAYPGSSDHVARPAVHSVHVHLADFSIDTASNGTVTFTDGNLTSFLGNPPLQAVLRRDLARAGVPAVITVGSMCENVHPDRTLEHQVFSLSNIHGSGRPTMGAETIEPARMPRVRGLTSPSSTTYPAGVEAGPTG